MGFYTTFWSVLRARPLEALGALYWHVSGRKLRARNRLRISIAQIPDAYSKWIERIERRSDVIANAPALIATWGRHPLFSIVVHPTSEWTSGDVDRLIDMAQAQIYPHWEVLIVSSSDTVLPAIDETPAIRIVRIGDTDEAGAIRAAAAVARGDFLLPLPSKVQLPPTALFHYAEALQAHPEAAMLIGDQDRIDAEGQRYGPWFKPQWNDDLALAQDHVSGAFVVSADAARALFRDDPAGVGTTSYAMALATAWRSPTQVRHIAHIQSHATDPVEWSSSNERVAVVRDHLIARGDRAALVSADRHGIVRVDWPLPSPLPLVSIIIPTRDNVNLLRACVSSLLERTRFPRFELLIVDNGSRQTTALAYLDQLSAHEAVRVIRDDRPYNFSQLNNLAVGKANGEYLCFLNNDTEIIDGDWLEAMMRQAVRPKVGAVGAKLLYGDGTIQHAGVTVGLGDAAGHSHRFQQEADIGYFARTHATHITSAVTAACLVVGKDKFLAVGGFDEGVFAIAFNDVDLCMKLRAAGWNNIYTPYAVLLHHESKSRGRDISPRHVERYRRELDALQAKWNTTEFLDPLHHVHLNRSTENYLINL